MEPHLSDADDVFARVLEDLEGRSSSPAPDADGLPRASRVRLTQVRSAAARTLDLYAELFQRSFETYADLAQAALHPGTDASPDTPLTLVGRAGEAAHTPLWLHNLTGAAVPSVGLFMTDLQCASGARIDGPAGSFAPPRIALEPHTSAEAELRVDIPAGAAPGRYHGHVLSPALPGSALAVCLVVEP